MERTFRLVQMHLLADGGALFLKNGGGIQSPGMWEASHGPWT